MTLAGLARLPRPARRAVLGALGLALAATVLAGGPTAAEPDPTGLDVPYPEAHTELRHVKSMVIQGGHPLAEAFGGIHHVYADEVAWEGLPDGDFADGALLVFDLLEAKSEENAIVEGSRRVLAVMRRDTERFADTGGWGFQAFAQGDPERPVVRDPASECFACHQSEADHGYVFTRPR